ncbi:FOG: RRM domain [Phaffia rhodozyma]|uniref:FOG: RRM domain n=1 Tax=Phaffia rhodozyma TaxID=264483 RepID=A0A0F7SHG8_PHARH|nr:FOG: RRM domain [Phaffia rhodozyma]
MSRGRSTSPKRLTASPSRPVASTEPNVVVIQHLTTNVKKGHLEEIFGQYGSISRIDLPLYRATGLNRSKAAIEYSLSSSALMAVSHMHQALLDGQILSVEISAFPLPPAEPSPSPSPSPVRKPRRSDSRTRSRSRSRSPYQRNRDGFRGSIRGARGARGEGVQATNEEDELDRDIEAGEGVRVTSGAEEGGVEVQCWEPDDDLAPDRSALRGPDPDPAPDPDLLLDHETDHIPVRSLDQDLAPAPVRSPGRGPARLVDQDPGPGLGFILALVQIRIQVNVPIAVSFKV